MTRVYLGIDTSCYTTSLCLVDEAYRVVSDERIILAVPSGGRGLAQSNMVFQHTKNLPELAERIAAAMPAGASVGAVAVTDKPRRRDDSYMPAFLAGSGSARSLAALLGVPLYRISHQENHLMAILRVWPELQEKSFFGLHVSGGTTDLLYVRPDTEGLDIERVGGTSDISAGQFIDRVGVALQLPFPAGVHLDKMAQCCEMSVRGSRVFFRDGEISFSGPESQYQRRIAAGKYEPAQLAQGVLATVWTGLQKLLDYARQHKGMTCLAAVGGVLSNRYLRNCLLEYGKQHGVVVYLAPDGYSADNASGAAWWAARRTQP